MTFSESFPATLTGGTNDVYGHGTHIAGLITGNGAASTGTPYERTFIGVAPNANLINLRVFDEGEQNLDSTVIEAIETAIVLKILTIFVSSIFGWGVRSGRATNRTRCVRH